MRQITEHLYQGNFDEVATLPEHITKVLSVGTAGIKEPQGTDYRVRKFYHLPLIEMSLSPGYEKAKRTRLRKSSEEEVIAAIELLKKIIDAGETVFLHCDAGICRSVGIAAGYLVRIDECDTLENAYSKVWGDNYGRRRGNTFNDTLIKVCEEEYWKEFDTYLDQLICIPKVFGIQA